MPGLRRKWWHLIGNAGASPPTLASATPAVGAAVGGTSVVLTGTNLTGATAVTFAGVAAAAFTVDSPTQITATTPALPAATSGAQDVVVTTPGGTATAASAFAWAPTITSLDVTSGDCRGGVAVTVTGNGFSTTPTFALGGIACTSVVRVSATSCTLVTPHCGGVAGLGLKALACTNPDAQTYSKASAYTQLLKVSYDTDGVNEFARNLSVAAPANGALSIAGWAYSSAVAGTESLFFLRNDARSEEMRVSLARATGAVSALVVSGGLVKANLAAPTTPTATWFVWALSRDTDGVWRWSVGSLGGALSTATGATWDGVPAFDRAFLCTWDNVDITEIHTGRIGMFGIWSSDLYASGELDAMLADPQHIPTGARNLILPGLETAITTLSDYGSDGTYDLSPQNAEAGDLVTAYPGQ